MQNDFISATNEMLQQAAAGEDVGDAKARQSLYGATEYTGDRPWLKHDSWDAELACKLIVFNYPIDMNGKGWDAVANWPIDKWGRKASIALRHRFDCALSIAKSSVHAGTIKEHDTPANWIEWAKSKGYSVAHLMPADATAANGKAVPVVTLGDAWIDKARVIADKLALERYQRGEREITARNISDTVAIELAKDSTTHGIRGERSAGNIRNIALKGWKFIPPTGTNGTKK